MKKISYITIIKNEEGYALLSVIIISGLVSGLILTLLIHVIYVNIITYKSINKRKVELVCRSAVELARLDTTLHLDSPYTIDVDSQTVLIQEKLKGLYLEVTAYAKKNNDSSKLKACFACVPPEIFNNAVVLSNKTARVVAAGKTKINGNVMFGGKQINTGRIFGIEQPDKSFHKGNIITNDNIPLKIFKDTLLTILFNNTPARYDTVIAGDFVLDSTKYSLLKMRNNILVQGQLTIKGNLLSKDSKELADIYVKNGVVFEGGCSSNLDITITSDSAVTIEESSSVANAVIISQSDINVAGNSKFSNTQLIGAKNITISNSVFEYPSVVLLYVDTSQKERLNSVLNIESSIINGSVFLICSTAGMSNNKSKMVINGSTIKGLVYSESYTELPGSIIGSLYTYRLRFYKRPTEYLNWFVDFNIDRTKLDKSFLTTLGLNQDADTKKGANRFEILKQKWIY